MIDIYKYSKKNTIYNFFFTKILRIDIDCLSRPFFYKENINLEFNEIFFYNYFDNNPITKWSGNINNRQHYQSNHDLQKLKDLKKPINILEKFLNKAIKCKIFKKNTIGRFKIKNIWFTIQKKNEGHSLHNHPKSILSGVFYFKVDKDSGGEINLHFENKKIEFKVQKNDLLMFNSHVFHSVNPYFGKNDRIAIAWDATYTF